MDPIAALLIAGIQKQRVKLQKIAKRYGPLAVKAFKRGDFEKAMNHGLKAAAALASDAILRDQQEKIRRANP